MKLRKLKKLIKKDKIIYVWFCSLYNWNEKITLYNNTHKIYKELDKETICIMCKMYSYDYTYIKSYLQKKYNITDIFFQNAFFQNLFFKWLKII